MLWVLCILYIHVTHQSRAVVSLFPAHCQSDQPTVSLATNSLEKLAKIRQAGRQAGGSAGGLRLELKQILWFEVSDLHETHFVNHTAIHT